MSSHDTNSEVNAQVLLLWILAALLTAGMMLCMDNIHAGMYFTCGLLITIGSALLFHQLAAPKRSIRSLANEFSSLKTQVICILDKQGFIRQCYGSSESVFGIEPHALLNHQLSEFLSGHNEDLATLISRGQSVVPIKQPNNTVFLAQICPCNQGNFDGHILLMRDLTSEITIQSELAEHARELSTVFNTIGDPVFLINLDGSVRNANEAARKIYGDIPIDALIYNIVRREDEPSIENSIQRCLAYFQPVRTEQHLQRQNRTVQLQIFPIMNIKNRIRQLLCIEHDITNERLMELEVRLQHQKLQDNYRRLRELDEAKTQWLNSVSHELRTPLTSIRSFSELLLTYDDTEPETKREFLEIIVKESDRLGRLIDELLDLARIESGSMPWHPEICDLVQLVEECNRSLKSIADQNFISIEIVANQEVVRIQSDPDRLQQVLINLVSNAIKFSPDGGRIIVSIDADEEEIRLAVEDEGPGISPADRQAIFERFSQGTHQLTDKPKGTGLGLTISHHIIKFMGGQIIVTDPITLKGARLLTNFPRSYTNEIESS
ncbi:MAG: PAS domain-containing protein [Planctomycetes bacterium]|nr:PAS domain-containing protein [Planctomycetota bacterium]